MHVYYYLAVKRAASFIGHTFCHLKIYGALLASADGIHVRYYGDTEPVV